ncbi:hypothetical protein BJV78DRAFT_1282854 [Lactifluus subvellereus]|nr:hypothetical protein BJV78DRAFT_1282854 [Lactifluus subvellereus]
MRITAQSRSQLRAGPTCDRSDSPTPEPKSFLPSPEKSLQKKRCGRNEEQVKYARDLATVSHAVIKLLGLPSHFSPSTVYSMTQRLPADILAPAKDRNLYALRRAVEGELGKDGEKGTVSDGPKAIHDLAVHEPSVFLSAFTELLPSILENVLAPLLALRIHACHAPGGLALGVSQIPPLLYACAALRDGPSRT